MAQPPASRDHLNRQVLLADYATEAQRRRHKDVVSRLEAYVVWLSEREAYWFEGLLTDYYHDLLRNHNPYTAYVYASAIRSRYKRLLEDAPALRQMIVPALSTKRSDEEREQLIDDILHHLYEDIEKPLATVKRPAAQTYRYLTREQVESLLQQPDPQTLIGLRDLAILALMFCTGLRDHEIAALTVDDLALEIDGETRLHVPAGKGSVERLVTYGDAIWSLVIVRRWLEQAGISSGPVFRGFFRNHTPRPQAISHVGVRRVLAQYPLEIEGEQIVLRPMDIRHTYTQHLYESGVDSAIIRANLGFTRQETVQEYLRRADADDTRPAPPELYQYNLSQLG